VDVVLNLSLKIFIALNVLGIDAISWIRGSTFKLSLLLYKSFNLLEKNVDFE
jgi:hypothetical protein